MVWVPPTTTVPQAPNTQHTRNLKKQLKNLFIPVHVIYTRSPATSDKLRGHWIKGLVRYEDTNIAHPSFEYGLVITSHIFIWHVITKAYLNFIEISSKLPLKLGHGWLIMTKSFMWKQLLFHTLNLMLIYPIPVNGRGPNILHRWCFGLKHI